MNRREFFAGVAALPLATPALSPQAGHATEAAPGGYVLPDMLASHLVNQVNRLAARWDQKRNQIKTAREIEARNRFVRRKIVEMTGGFPPQNPLGAKTVKVIERPGYRVENVMFQSRPDFWVTGNLYVPTSGGGRFPAIVSPCGHYPQARMLPQYQRAYLSLVHNGFIVLAYDPIGQGERRQYWNPETDVTDISGGPTYEHSLPGQLLFLWGESLTAYMIWDGMRAIDYLLERPEVDPAKIGCTGHSGGGTLTKFIAALDERVKCAVIHEGGTKNRWPIRLTPYSPIGVSDVEQNMFPSVNYGIDNVDIQVAIAPRPMMATIESYSPDFDVASEQIRVRYRQLGVAGRFATVSSDDPHAWTYKLRLATADWFSRWLYGRPGPKSEPEYETEPPADLTCMPNGSLRYSNKGENIWSLIARRQAELPPSRPLPANAHEVDAYRQSLSTSIRELIHYQKCDQALAPRRKVDLDRGGYRIEKIEFLSEALISIPTWVFVPKQRQPGSAPILYFSEAGKDVDGMEFEGAEASGLRPGVLEDLVRDGNLVVAADVRGVGETRTAHKTPAETDGGAFRHIFDSENALTYLAWYLDQSLFGMRVQDVLRTVDYALSRPDAGSKSVRVIGRDMAALWVLYAAALDPRIEAVVCHGGLISYRSLAATDRYLHGGHIFVPRVLEQFDLPHVAAAVAVRRITLVAPLDGMKRHVEADAAREAYRWTQEVYDRAGASGQFQIVGAHPDQRLASQYLRLL